MRFLLVVIAAAALIAAVVTLTETDESTVAVEPISRANRLRQNVDSLQARLNRVPGDASGWARLGVSYVELARTTTDPTYYAKAQGALDRSLKLKPAANGEAMIGMGALANARHDFAAAKDWGTRAQAVMPDTAEVYGVLADASTQLGEDKAAMDAVQRMLDLRPNVAAFTRASYHFELHGRQAEAIEAMRRGLDSATSSDEIAFCQFHLGELAWNSGQVDEASSHYEQGLVTNPKDTALLHGRAKVAAAQGRADEALTVYRDLTVRAPQYLPDYARLLSSSGRNAEADQQYEILAKQRKLLAAQGASDDLVASAVAADRGDKAEALRLAEAEWAKRQSVFVADAMAWALHLNGRHAEALSYADKAVASGWRDATVLAHRTAILEALR
ncbi:lipopolysaccharide assembly protein LapB [Kibdelosporangium persicum]|uniref:Flp pilus assembly protein TadD n=1 Tax=Kibdelosporangium persicum TaxID=2698649 RepID=A0ABX2EVH9_9PSEU|nr:tetratricopeptide repeat protein [Kibdelosporangium persicum]NRN62894.1 Flp pilus assembly protein TadD [Kibdelosporangium persicum]